MSWTDTQSLKQMICLHYFLSNLLTRLVVLDLFIRWSSRDWQNTAGIQKAVSWLNVFYQIAEGCIMETLDKFGHHKKVILACQEQMQPSSFLADIFYFRICSYTEEIAMINCLEKFLAEKKDAFGRSEGEVLLLDDGTASKVKQIFREANVAADWMAS